MSKVAVRANQDCARCRIMLPRGQKDHLCAACRTAVTALFEQYVSRIPDSLIGPARNEAVQAAKEDAYWDSVRTDGGRTEARKRAAAICSVAGGAA